MRARGFTLIELLVTVAIVALLTSVAVPIAELAVQRTKEVELRAALRDIRTAIDAYKQAVDDGRIANTIGKSGYPPTLKAMVDGVPDAKNPNPEKANKLYFLRRVPRDPMNPDTAIPAEESWGKRSYASPPDQPKEGDDVYDVYSKAPGNGINGVPYKDW